MEKLNDGAKKLDLHLDPGQLEQFQVYYQELLTWNRHMNLTAITGYEEVQVKHFLDALTVTLAVDKPADIATMRIIDIGTGGGIPGIPLKILFPSIRLSLLDATARKASFLYHLKHKLGLENIEIIVGRAEEIAHLSEYRERFDMVIARAVAPLPTLLELTLPFCSIGGRSIAQKKGDIDPEISQATRAIRTLGGKLREVKPVKLAELTDNRYLVIIDKVAPTPDNYPRHPGIPTKRPIV